MINYAIAYYGHARTFKQTYPTHERRLIKRLKPDVFIHTWDKTDSNMQSWYKKDNSHIQNLNPTLLIDTFKPKSFCIDDTRYKETGKKVFGYKTDVSNVNNYLYTIKEALVLALKQRCYKYILLTRMDLLYHFNLSFEESSDIISYPLKISSHNNKIITNGSDLLVQLNKEHAQHIVNKVNNMLSIDMYKHIEEKNIKRLEDVFEEICTPFKIIYKPFNYSILRINGEILRNSIYYHNKINTVKINKKHLLDI